MIQLDFDAPEETATVPTLTGLSGWIIMPGIRHVHTCDGPVVVDVAWLSRPGKPSLDTCLTVGWTLYAKATTGYRN